MTAACNCIKKFLNFRNFLITFNSLQMIEMSVNVLNSITECNRMELKPTFRSNVIGLLIL
jgi:hypothetical protein